MKTTVIFLLAICYVFLGTSQSSLNINLLYNWKDTSITPTTAHYNTYNEIWGYANNGREYAIIGSTRGTHIFDVTNPINTTMVDFIQGRDTGNQIIHRDYHDYKGYLYAVSDEGDASLQIMDLSYLPDSAPVVYDSDTAFKKSHNIFIDTATHKMYVCGGENKFDVYDLTNPLNPIRIKRCQTDIPWWASTVGNNNSGYVHDAYVKNDTAWVNGELGLFAIDFTDMANPVLLGSITSYPDQGYNHSGWLSEDGNTYVLADENHGKKVKILDVSDLSNISFMDTIGSDVHPNSIPHNLIFHNNFLYVSFYMDGVYVWDMKNPQSPILAGFFDTSNEPHNAFYRGNWGVYPFLPSGVLLASDMQEGLFVLDASQATSIQQINNTTDVFTVYPNPFNNQINILGTKQFGRTYTLRLLDINGKTILSKTFKNYFLSKQLVNIPSHLTKGTYILSIEGEQYNQTKKLIKN